MSEQLGDGRVGVMGVTSERIEAGDCADELAVVVVVATNYVVERSKRSLWFGQANTRVRRSSSQFLELGSRTVVQLKG